MSLFHFTEMIEKPIDLTKDTVDGSELGSFLIMRHTANLSDPGIEVQGHGAAPSPEEQNKVEPRLGQYSLCFRSGSKMWVLRKKFDSSTSSKYDTLVYNKDLDMPALMQHAGMPPPLFKQLRDEMTAIYETMVEKKLQYDKKFVDEDPGALYSFHLYRSASRWLNDATNDSSVRQWCCLPLFVLHIVVAFMGFFVGLLLDIVTLKVILGSGQSAAYLKHLSEDSATSVYLPWNRSREAKVQCETAINALKKKDELKPSEWVAVMEPFEGTMTYVGADYGGSDEQGIPVNCSYVGVRIRRPDAVNRAGAKKTNVIPMDIAGAGAANMV